MVSYFRIRIETEVGVAELGRWGKGGGGGGGGDSE